MTADAIGTINHGPAGKRYRGPALRAAYALSQAARTAWFAGQYIAAARLSPPMETAPPPGLPGWGVIMGDLTALYRQDYANIEAGIYPPPGDLIPKPLAVMRSARRFFEELPGVTQRRRRRENSAVFTPENKGRYPRYYLQNFHYQRDGWLSEESAAAYDHQVEVLFTGGADAMRRQSLPAIRAELAAKGPGLRMIDIACGTGRYLREVRRAFPHLKATALDLSPQYLDHARRLLRRWPDTDFVEAPAEQTGLESNSMDIATSVYLFHELPAKVRKAVAAEMFRLLKPGGLLVFVDSIQLGDHPPFDALLHRFPVAFHEPYYANYIESDLEGLFEAAGFEVEAVERAFFSRVMILRKPG